MGLGKTLTSIAVLWSYIGPTVSATGLYGGGKAIVVCPSSLIDNWEAEVRKWLGVKLYPMCVKPGGAQKRSPRQTIERFQYSNSASLLIISYEVSYAPLHNSLAGQYWAMRVDVSWTS
jgi:DNA repair and recombination protein RAD54 and RAD54-like protein